MLTTTRNFARGFFNFAFGPLADILSLKTGYQIELELPGVKRDDITVDCEQGVLTVSASKKEPTDEGKKRIHSEREFGTVSRSFQLPSNVETDKLEAVLADGVLTLTLPKKESSKIEVKIQ